MIPFKQIFQILLVIAVIIGAVLLFLQGQQNKEFHRAIQEVREIQKNADIVALIDSIHSVRERKTIDSLRRLKVTVDSMKAAQRLENTKLRNRNAALENRVRDIDLRLGKRPDF